MGCPGSRFWGSGITQASTDHDAGSLCERYPGTGEFERPEGMQGPHGADNRRRREGSDWTYGTAHRYSWSRREARSQLGNKTTSLASISSNISWRSTRGGLYLPRGRTSPAKLKPNESTTACAIWPLNRASNSPWNERSNSAASSSRCFDAVDVVTRGKRV